MERFVANMVARAVAHAKLVIAICLILAVAAGFYSARYLSLDSNTANMISSKLPWKQQLAEINRAFPQNSGLLVVMIDGRNADVA